MREKTTLQKDLLFQAYQRALESPTDFHPALDLEIFNQIPSTNDAVFDLAKQGRKEGLVVFAHQQSAGRGRLGRRWESPPSGNLYFSILLNPELGPADVPPLTLMTGLACFKTLQNHLPKGLWLKWPNDLYVSQHKLGGILCEMDFRDPADSAVVIGIGLNVFSSASDYSDVLQPHVTSMLQHSSSDIDLSQLAGELLARFFKMYGCFLKQGFKSLKEDCEKASGMKGHQVEIREEKGSYKGICAGLDENGFLIVGTSSGLHRVIAGDVVRLD